VGVGRDVTNSNIFTGDIKIEALVTRSLHQLRAPVGDFVGRELEIDTLINALRRENRACITGISGMGGIGKTELALLVAERLRNEYPDAQFFINLEGTDADPRSPQEAMTICIRAFLGPEAKLPEEPEQLLHLYRSQLSGKRVLLLLDNAADSTQVRPLLPPTGCAVLVTSRQSLTLPGMTPLTLHSLTGEEARQLLLEIAARAEPAAEQICKLCGYLPLALRAAGSLLAIRADLDPADYAAQLQDERRRLERIGTEGVEISVATSFNLSYEQLASEAARVFRLLSVFPATFDAAVEEVVCADAGHVQLSDLVRRSLVLYDQHTKRYRLHDLARLFADTKLSAEERDVGQKHFAMQYRDILTEHARAQLAIKQRERIKQVDLDEAVSLTTEMSEELLMLDEALKKLAAVDKRKALVVEYRYFGGFTVEEIAHLLGIAAATVEREWRLARSWLKREIREDRTTTYQRNIQA
jgi:RNA polymerase sigma factor (sigma-70 family)